MSKKLWRAKMRCQMPWRDFEKGEMIELDDKDVTVRVKALFECLTPDEAKAADDAKRGDPDLKVMIERLKAAKIPLKRGIKPEEVKELFNKFLVEDANANGVADSVKRF